MFRALYLVFLVALAVHVSGQPAGKGYKCNSSSIQNFTSTLPNKDECTKGFNVSYQLENTAALNSTEGTKSITNFCKPDCAGKVISWLKTNETCQDAMQAADIELSCYLRNSATSHCRDVFPDSFSLSGGVSEFRDLIDDITQGCRGAVSETPKSNSCSDKCKDALNGFIKEDMGCCYQVLYNNTNYLSGLVSRGIINKTQHDGLVQLGNHDSNPWIGCNVTAPGNCTSNPTIPTSGTNSTMGEVGLMLIILLSAFAVIYGF